MHSGPPHPSNEGYAYAKRVSEVLMRAYNEQYGHRYVTVIPTNVYGPHDNFDIEDAHVVPGLIHKCYKAKLQGTNLTICGSGKPLRQFIFSDDLAELLLWTLLQYTGSDSLILAPDRVDEVMISDLACLIAQSMKFDEDRLIFDASQSDGQLRKTASNERLRKNLPGFTFTPLKLGIDATVKWFLENYESCRR
mmetsp:Transcript_10649/g.35679  ORF Transcript_10649/g.35679 Transcript_10649/m.35679 type:complete len:193 (-) Transcript_10649:604-1182(-)